MEFREIATFLQAAQLKKLLKRQPKKLNYSQGTVTIQNQKTWRRSWASASLTEIGKADQSDQPRRTVLSVRCHSDEKYGGDQMLPL